MGAGTKVKIRSTLGKVLLILALVVAYLVLGFAIAREPLVIRSLIGEGCVVVAVVLCRGLFRSRDESARRPLWKGTGGRRSSVVVSVVFVLWAVYSIVDGVMHGTSPTYLALSILSALLDALIVAYFANSARLLYRPTSLGT